MAKYEVQNPYSTEKKDDSKDPEACGQYFGKYRGVVLNNVDPMKRGRLQIQVPDVTQLAPASWAEACFPGGGMQMGVIVIPMIGAGVWVEFEQGDPDYPIWTGSFLGSPAEYPALAQMTPPAVPGLSMTTPLQNGMVINDVPGAAGGILIKAGLASITVNDAGITIQNGKGASIMMTGLQVIINGGALMVQ
jgi:uncharacterized protein involved in type VI secretion and phage assembly